MVDGDGYTTGSDYTYDSFGTCNQVPSLVTSKPIENHTTRRLSFNEIAHPVTLSWRDITVRVPRETGMCDTAQHTYKTIIKDVSGLVEPGSLLAILGASGAGKSTLLNMLTQRNYGGLKVSGEVCLNGSRVEDMSSISAYVQQDDLFLTTLTVEEHLKFQALLRMDKDLSYAWKMKQVQDVMKEMGLEKCRDVQIGTPDAKKGISGGERKRLSFASEVLTNPSLLFCDEPTSGLDSFRAMNVVEILKHMAHKGRTIVCTIHQPSSEVFALFNRVLLMVDGRIAFLGSSADALTFFDECGYPCPEHFNPADHYILTLAVSPHNENQCRHKIQKICESYEKSIYAAEVDKQISQVRCQSRDTIVGRKNNTGVSRYKVAWCIQFCIVLWRSLLVIGREKGVFRTRIIQAVAVSILMGLVYFQQEITQVGITNINGALFFMQINMSVGYTFAVVMAFPHIFPVFRKENHDGMYRVDAFYLAYTLAEVPHFLLIPWLFVTISHWMVGLYPTFWAYFINLLTITLVCNVSVSFGYILSTISNDTKQTILVAGVVTVVFIMIGGFYVNVASIPLYLKWLQYLSWFTYAFEIVVVTQWINIDHIPCDLKNASDICSYSGKCFRTGQEVIESFAFRKDNVAFDFFILCLQLIIFKVIAFVILYIRCRKNAVIKISN